jgi:hypothetical protein
MLVGGQRVWLTLTLVQDLVLARSALERQPRLRTASTVARSGGPLFG